MRTTLPLAGLTAPDCTPHPAIATVEEFYAHALAIEREAADRYAEFDEYFARRGEDVLAALCRNLSLAERDHFDELVHACKHLALPAIAAADFRWLEAEAPETPAREILYRLATPLQLLTIALAAELRARAFFVWVAQTAPLHEVQELASIMAAEELEHVRWVGQAIEYHGAAGLAREALFSQGIGPGTAQA